MGGGSHASAAFLLAYPIRPQAEHGGLSDIPVSRRPL